MGLAPCYCKFRIFSEDFCFSKVAKFRVIKEGLDGGGGLVFTNH